MADNMHSLKDLLSNSLLANITNKAVCLHTLNKYMQAILGPELAQLYRVANLEDNILRIEVANAAVLYNLKLKQNSILTSLQLQYPSIKQIQYKINPELYKVKEK